LIELRGSIQLGENTRIGFGRCFGTFGELLQGAVSEDKRNFLVTLPITKYSTARFTVLSDADDIYVFPEHKQKARKLAKQLIHSLGMKVGGILYLQSELAEGKGCASSSADMAASAYAIQSAIGCYIAPSSLARLMASIEPSDGVMYPGVVAFYHREGALHSFLGNLPPLVIVALDEGGQVDTIEFNSSPLSFSKTEIREYEKMLADMEKAVASHRLADIGAIATCSAIMNQKILPKIHLDLMLDLHKQYEALGVVVAHSGTYLGLLLDPASPIYHQSLLGVIAALTQRSLAVSVFNTCSFQKESRL